MIQSLRVYLFSRKNLFRKVLVKGGFFTFPINMLRKLKTTKNNNKKTTNYYIVIMKKYI